MRWGLSFGLTFIGKFGVFIRWMMLVMEEIFLEG